MHLGSLKDEIKQSLAHMDFDSDKAVAKANKLTGYVELIDSILNDDLLEIIIQNEEGEAVNDEEPGPDFAA